MKLQERKVFGITAEVKKPHLEQYELIAGKMVYVGNEQVNLTKGSKIYFTSSGEDDEFFYLRDYFFTGGYVDDKSAFRKSDLKVLERKQVTQ